MEVAIPCTMSSPPVIRISSSDSFPPRMPSTSILPPMKASRTKPIQGIIFRKPSNCSAIVRTQIHPTMGIRNWNPAKVPAIMNILFRLIPGCCRPLAMDTEKASMASPTPRRALSNANRKTCMAAPLFFRQADNKTGTGRFLRRSQVFLRTYQIILTEGHSSFQCTAFRWGTPSGPIAPVSPLRESECSRMWELPQAIRKRGASRCRQHQLPRLRQPSLPADP